MRNGAWMAVTPSWKSLSPYQTLRRDESSRPVRSASPRWREGGMEETVEGLWAPQSRRRILDSRGLCHETWSLWSGGVRTFMNNYEGRIKLTAGEALVFLSPRTTGASRLDVKFARVGDPGDSGTLLLQ